ncbi:hypothetical protein B0H17DRAFT_1148782 [Mycena rosella]|uniref:Uncharacterized protein n=1 Tax=Mycena rosella TaxID=1033263 RepID=A0AAD7C986_MYCRO|nr:hypothetical protein B0H17DRAFT_1148782 [Mycena rosella]
MKGSTQENGCVHAWKATRDEIYESRGWNGLGRLEGGWMQRGSVPRIELKGGAATREGNGRIGRGCGEGVGRCNADSDGKIRVNHEDVAGVTVFRAWVATGPPRLRYDGASASQPSHVWLASAIWLPTAHNSSPRLA